MCMHEPTTKVYPHAAHACGTVPAGGSKQERGGGSKIAGSSHTQVTAAGYMNYTQAQRNVQTQTLDRRAPNYWLYKAITAVVGVVVSYEG